MPVFLKPTTCLQTCQTPKQFAVKGNGLYRPYLVLDVPHLVLQCLCLLCIVLNSAVTDFFHDNSLDNKTAF